MSLPFFTRRPAVPSGIPAVRKLASFGLCALLSAPSTAFAAKPRPEAPRPIATIPVGPLGYRPMGSLYLMLRLSSMSLDFIDADRLLFTFHAFRLMTREGSRDHDDQNIQAVVLSVPGGTVDATAEWRLHDRQRYLFPLANGSFLLRQGDEIFHMGPDLHLHPYLRFKEPILTSDIAPDGSLMTIESKTERHNEARHKELVEHALLYGETMPDEDVLIRMIHLPTRTVVGEATTNEPVRIAAAEAGFVNNDRPPGHAKSSDYTWVLTLHTYDKQERELGRVQSACVPAEQFINAGTVLVTTCNPHSADRFVTALTTEGREAWTGQWDARYIQPSLAFSQKGSVFGISWIHVSHPVDASDPVSDEDVQGQVVDVLSTATGHLLLEVPASPVVSAGQNFALSPDGRRLAVLYNGAIGIYEVPEDSVK